MLFLELKQLNRTVAFLGQNMRLRVQGKKVSQTQVNLDFQVFRIEKERRKKERQKKKRKKKKKKREREREREREK